MWNAFSRLSGRRNVGGFGAVSAIPYVEIHAFLDIVLKLEDPEQRAEFIELVEFLDVNYLKAAAERAKQEQKKRESASNTKRTRT